MTKQFWGVLAAIIIAFVAIFITSGDTDKTNSNGGSGKPTSHIKGLASSSVKLVEYGDFQCPYCQQYEPTVAAVVEEYKDKIAFQFRNYPIVNAHPNAFAASRAAEAAHLQGKFWEMHDALYSPGNWQNWTTASDPNELFDSYAAQLGLDTLKFRKDFASSVVNDAVNADVKSGNELGVTGTPTFFLNGKKVEIANTIEAFKKVLDAELKKQADK